MALLVASQPYSDGPPPGHTGGFGEPTCHACHFDNDLNDSLTHLEVNGLPDPYQAGRTYELRVRVGRDGMRMGGFQLAARFASGQREREQAGALHGGDGILLASEGDSTGVEFASHAAPRGVGTGGFAEWPVSWTAPASGPVVVHVAGNAANGDDSELGDHVVTRRYELYPAEEDSLQPGQRR